MSLWDDLIGNTASDASNSAAADTYAKQQAATAGERAAGSNYNAGMDTLAQGFQPYVDAGSSALTRLMAGLGLGPGAADFTKAYQSTPGYASGLATGTKAASAALNAGNVDQSGKALKTLQRYGSDYEDQKSGNYLSQLMGLTNTGRTATGQQVATEGQGLQGQLSADTSAFGGDMTAAGTIGQGEVAGAQAKQQGLTNLMQTGAYLGGAALGGGMPRMSSFSGTSLSPSVYGPGAASGGNNGGVVWGK